MTYIKRLDFGWLFLLCGLVLAISAIVLPAHQDLQHIKAKRNTTAANLDDLEHRMALYGEFLQDIHENNSEMKQRLLEMQLNIQPPGTPVVFDNSASHTPLDWIAQRSRKDRVIVATNNENSLLSGLSSGRSRLLLVGAAAFAMFIGFLGNPSINTN